MRCLEESLLAREAGDAALQAQIDTLQTQVDGLLAPVVHAVGDTLLDGGIVFWVDDSGEHGLAAWPSDDASGNWYQANHDADAHGPGWRLPAKHELNLLYLQKDVVGGIGDNGYWSSAEFDSESAWFQNFGNGSQDIRIKSNPISVRAVRAF